MTPPGLVDTATSTSPPRAGRIRCIARPLSRRLLLSLAGISVVAGCTSEADRINGLVFGATRKDPLFLWRPAWAISASDMETRLGGIYPEAAASLSHDLRGTPLPGTAVTEATSVAVTSGWQLRSDGVGYVRPIADSNLKLWVTFSVTADLDVLSMTFVGQYV